MRYKRISFWVFIIVFTVFAISICTAGYFLFSTKGSGLVAKRLFAKYFGPGSVAFKKVDGNFARGLSFRELQVENLQYMPAGSIIRIQKLGISFTAFGIEGLRVSVENGRLRMPDSDPMLFYGDVKNSNFTFNMYSKRVGVRQILSLFSGNQSLKKVSGSMSDVDILLKGTVEEPLITGSFIVEELTRNGFLLTNSPGSFSIDIKDMKKATAIEGTLTLKSGSLKGPKTAVINLKESMLVFSGDPKLPTLNIEGTSTVEDVTINIMVKGTFDSPEIKLRSDPSMPEERIMFMLATGKRWGGADESMKQGKITPELACDFIDYFVFSGSSGKFAERFGISEVALKYDDMSRGVSAKKKISKETTVSYGVEQSRSEKEKPSTHTVGGEYKLTENLSVEGKKDIKQKDEDEQVSEESKTNSEVLLKYKKKF
ncbi:translocation/assembly module TamB domain-containing protein [Candidatus Omnitrophota bacterium]